ncbi:twin-arginine translocase TatA/TatE family subunit (plasmid) [Deinococcus radiomollis]|uniref:Sec-independent protein translocase subunit TatA/TatB n=1 Tax=Deinococcus radiomollis TaxID=468916 RepID=UPI003891DDE5
MLTPETMLIVAGAAFLLFGGKKLPELGRSLGQGIREFKSGTQGLKDELNAQVSVTEPSTPKLPQVMAAAASPVILPSAPVVHVVTLNTGAPAESEKG